MATTYPLATLAATITATGITAPTYADILASLQASYYSIYGSDSYIDPDSQDGQMMAVYAQGIHDTNQTAIDVYNSFSPQTASGAALSSRVKMNGIARAVSSNSSVDLLVVGEVGRIITNGIAGDAASNQWLLPATVTIPDAGEITVTATAQNEGAITAAPGTVTKILTPTQGWQTVTNPSDATTGEPVELDPALKQRQTTSTAIPSLTVLDGMVGAVADISGVTRYAYYENDTSAVDANGIPAHAVSFVVEGGDAVAIATAIASKKTPGGVTFGTTTEQIPDAYGIPRAINFFRPTDLAVTATIVLTPLTGYTSVVALNVQQAVSDYINAVKIGGGDAKAVDWDGAITAAKGVTGGSTFKIKSLTLAGAGITGTPDVALLFNQAAVATPTSITITPG